MRENSPGETRAQTPRRNSETTRSQSRNVSPRRSLVTPGSLRRTRVSSGIRAALDRATRNDAVGTPYDAGPSPSGTDARTTKYRQVGGLRHGRWRDLSGRFTQPPSPRDEVISQQEAVSRRSSREASPAPAAEQRDEQHVRDRSSAQDRSQQSPAATRRASRTRKINDVDRSWERVTHADANAAAQAANAAAAAGTAQDGNAAAATAAGSTRDVNGTQNTADAPPDHPGTAAPQQDDAGNDGIRADANRPGAGALGSDAERSTITETHSSGLSESPS